jgi:hypothetical protein
MVITEVKSKFVVVNQLEQMLKKYVCFRIAALHAGGGAAAAACQGPILVEQQQP